MHSKCNFCTIRKTTIFANLKESDLNRIERFVREKTFPKKHIIFWEDDPVDSIYLIKRGNIKLYKTQSDGRSQILRIDGTGGILGFDSLFSDTYLATAESIVECTLCQISARDFRKLLEKEPEINICLLKAVSKELEKNEHLLFTLGTRTAKERLAYFLLNLFVVYQILCYLSRRSNLWINRITHTYNSFFFLLAFFSFTQAGLNPGCLTLNDRNSFPIKPYNMNFTFSFSRRSCLFFIKPIVNSRLNRFPGCLPAGGRGPVSGLFV